MPRASGGATGAVGVVQAWGELPGSWDPNAKAWQLPRCVFAQGLRTSSRLPGDGAAPSLHKAALGGLSGLPGPVRLTAAHGGVYPHPFPHSLSPALRFQLEVRSGEVPLSHGSVPTGRHCILSAQD